MVYSGPFDKCQEYFDRIGHPCPPGFNIADYLVDLTMHASRIETDPTPTPSEGNTSDAEATTSLVERRPARGRKNSIREWQEHQLYDPRPRSNDSNNSGPSLRDEFGTAQQWASLVGESRPVGIETPPGNGNRTPRSRRSRRENVDGQIHAAEHLATLVYSYENSSISDQIREEIYDAVNANGDEDSLPEEIPKSKRIGWLSQFVILSTRTFKNLYRNPMLMLTHYSIAILMARMTMVYDGADCSFMWISLLQY